MRRRIATISAAILTGVASVTAVPFAGADTYDNIVRSFNSVNECEHYRQTVNRGRGACIPYKDTTAWVLVEKPNGSGTSMHFSLF